VERQVLTSSGRTEHLYAGAIGAREGQLLARLIALTLLAASAALANGGPPPRLPPPQVMECRKEAAQRFINDFIQIGPTQERIKGSQIFITSFRNDNPFEDYVADCLKRRHL
jgi:hypothetical protein